MSETSTSSRQALAFALALFALLLLIACGKKAEAPAVTEQTKQPTAAPASPVSSPDQPPAPSSDITFPKAFGRSTGDLDAMAKNRNIRALVLLNPIGFFYDKGQPRGVMYEALEEFQKFAQPEAEDRKAECEGHIPSYAGGPD